MSFLSTKGTCAVLRTFDSALVLNQETSRSNLLDSLPDLYFISYFSDTICFRYYHNDPNRPDEYYRFKCCNQGESILTPFHITVYIFDQPPGAFAPLVMDSSTILTDSLLSGECVESDFLVPWTGHPRYQYPYQDDHTYYYVFNTSRDSGTWRFPENDIIESDYSNNIDSFYISPLSDPIVLPMDTAICQGDSLKIELGAEYHSFLWSDSTTNDHFMVYDDGVYWVEARTTIRCFYKVRDTIEVSQLRVDYDEPLFDVDCERHAVVAALGEDDSLNYLWSNGSNESITYFYHSDSVWLEVHDGVCSTLDYYALPSLPNFNGFPRFQNDTVDTGLPVEYFLDLDPLLWDVKWMPADRMSCDTCFRTMIDPSSREEEVQVILTHTSGCQYEYSFGLYWDKEGDLWTPNAFSPNGDGINDTWRVYQKDEEIILFTGAIYDRWGNEIESWDEVDNISWDGMFNGEVLDSGVYLYWLQYKYPDGEERTIYGDINLFR